jgi:hypothetical protein
MGFKALKSRRLLTRPTRGCITAEHRAEKIPLTKVGDSVVVQWLTFELGIPEVSGSDFTTEIFCPNWRLHGLPQPLPRWRTIFQEYTASDANQRHSISYTAFPNMPFNLLFFISLYFDSVGWEPLYNEMIINFVKVSVPLLLRVLSVLGAVRFGRLQNTLPSAVSDEVDENFMTVFLGRCLNHL